MALKYYSIQISLFTSQLVIKLLRLFYKVSKVISFITEMEILSWPSLSEKEHKIAKAMIGECRVIQMNNTIRDEAITIRRSTRLKLPDAIVAATSKYLDLTLISADADLKKVKGIDLIYLVP
ncbi:MAG: PIN domain-containing protein [Cytophagia bacterium]|nr:PIN domain-containing protein [Cytophagia bacterium]NBW39182.1 PIN domain-containing protein [Cytophagia bacterium]